MKTDDYYVIALSLPDAEVPAFWVGRGMQFLEDISKAVRFKDVESAQRVAGSMVCTGLRVLSMCEVLEFGDSHRPVIEFKPVAEPVAQSTWVITFLNDEHGPVYWFGHGTLFDPDLLRAMKFDTEEAAELVADQLMMEGVYITELLGGVPIFVEEEDVADE